MTAADIMGTVCDRLVGGVMFHLEHADLCEWAGVPWLYELHRDGYEHDSKCLRKMRHLCVHHLGTFATEGRQERSHLLDAYKQTKKWELKADIRKTVIHDAMRDWVDWEDGTVTVLTSACKRLSDAGFLLLSDKVRDVIKDTSNELAEARELLSQMDAVCWDMSHILEMHK